MIREYQRVTTLTMGELWAWPSALKLALIEHNARGTYHVTDGVDQSAGTVSVTPACEIVDSAPGSMANGSSLSGVSSGAGGGGARYAEASTSMISP